MNYELFSVALAFACLFIILVAVVVIIMAWKTIKENNSLVARLNSANAAVARYMEALKECREWAARIRTNLDASEDARERLIQKCQTAGKLVAEGKRRLGRAERCIERLKVLVRAQRDEIQELELALSAPSPVKEFKPTPLGTGLVGEASTQSTPDNSHSEILVTPDQVRPAQVYDLATEPVPAEQMESILRRGYGGSGNVLMAGN